MKIGWLLKSRKITSLLSMLGVAACTVIGGSLYNWRQEQAVKRAEAERIQAELESEAEQMSLEAELAAELAAQIPQLSDSQVDLLNQIENALEQEQFAIASKLMLDNEEQLWTLYYDLLEGEPYLFCEGQLFKDVHGMGMVLRKPSKVFYGAFEDGSPEGRCTALQAIEIDYPRFE